MPGRSEQDGVLIGKVRLARDRNALDQLARHYGPRLKAWLMHRGALADAAEDIVQDVLVAVWKKADKYDETKGKFSTWIYSMTRNRWIDRARKESRSEPTSPSDLARLLDAPTPAADADYDRTEASKAVRRELAQLSPEQKHVLYLAFFEGLTHAEIAERTGLPLGTVKSRIRAPLKKMQKGLSRYSEHFDE